MKALSISDSYLVLVIPQLLDFGIINDLCISVISVFVEWVSPDEYVRLIVRLSAMTVELPCKFRFACLSNVEFSSSL